MICNEWIATLKSIHLVFYIANFYFRSLSEATRNAKQKYSIVQEFIETFFTIESFQMNFSDLLWTIKHKIVCPLSCQ